MENNNNQKSPNEYEVALSWWENGNYDDAIDLMKRVRESGFLGDTASTIGTWLLWLGKLEDARKYFQISLDENDESAPAGLGVTNWELGHLEEAETYLRLAVQSDYSATNMASLAEFLLYRDDQGARSEAEIILRVLYQELESEHLNSLTIWAGFNLAILLHERHELKQAEILYRQLTRLGDTSASVNLGCLLHDAGNCFDGDAVWLELIHKTKEEPSTLSADQAAKNLSLCLAAQGRKKEVEELLSQTGIEVGPSSKIVRISRTSYSSPWGS